jgi:3-oxoacyl-[acyl-carrier protein] reductase
MKEVPTMLLEGKTAVVYGGGGSIGSGVARAFAREGARVYLAGRTRAKLERVAEQIRADGGTAKTDEVDALDAAAVDRHAEAVAADAGSLDVSFNLITHPYTFGTPLAEMEADDFMAPIETATRSTFVTARAAARHMIPQGSGVILIFGGSGGTTRGFFAGGTVVAFEAMESMRRQLSAELGPHGIRVVTLRTNGIPESLPDGSEVTGSSMAEESMLGRAATLEDVGHSAAFAASDRARTITAAVINISAGALVD